MDKQAVLDAITKLSADNLLSKDEVVNAYRKGRKNIAHEDADITLSDLLYFIGAIIVFSGVWVLIGQNWDALNPITRVVTSFGVGIAAFFAGVLLNKEDKYGAIGNAFHLIGALSIPLGLGVIFNQFGFDVSGAGMVSFIAWLVALLYAISFLVYRKTMFLLFTIIYATCFFFAFTEFLVGTNPFGELSFYEYRFLVVGVSYCFLGHYFASTTQKKLSNSLYGFGSVFALAAALALGGWTPTQNSIWELLFPGIVFLTLYLSVYLKSKPLLVSGTFFLMGYILKMTGEYFSGTLGWPFSLMICGIALIAIGYYAFTLNKKYLTTE